MLMEVGKVPEGRLKLSCAIKEAIGVRGIVRELYHRTRVEVLDLDTVADTSELTPGIG